MSSLRSKKYVIMGNPIPWKRPGRNKDLYFDKQKIQKENCGEDFLMQHGKEPLFVGPLRIDYYFYFQIPKSFSKVKQESMINKLHMIDPDKTNIEKFYEDAAKGILFKDDNVISVGYQEKRYDDGKGPRVEITIWEIR